MTARVITQFLHSRKGSNTLVLIAFIALCVAVYFAPQLKDSGAWSTKWQVSLAGLAMTLATAILLQLTNKRFNMLRSDSALTPCLFMTMSLALPTLAIYPGTPSMLALTMVAGAHLLFTTFSDPYRRRRVFLLFATVTALGMCNCVYWYYLPVMLIGCGQMRIFSLKTLLAALLGIITPPWIALGSTLITIDDIEWPRLSIPSMETSDITTITIFGNHRCDYNCRCSFHQCQSAQNLQLQFPHPCAQRLLHPLVPVHCCVHASRLQQPRSLHTAPHGHGELSGFPFLLNQNDLTPQLYRNLALHDTLLCFIHMVYLAHALMTSPQ